MANHSANITAKLGINANAMVYKCYETKMAARHTSAVIPNTSPQLLDLCFMELTARSVSTYGMGIITTEMFSSLISSSIFKVLKNPVQ